MESYWDLYVAYVHKCVADNWANDIDPAHYNMEWNHFLPKCVFGDQPIGQWLTLKQHAIATALQTLALKRNCLMGLHLKYLPETLLEKVYPLFTEFTRGNMYKGNAPGSPTLTPEQKSEYEDARMRGLRKCWEKPGPRAGHTVGKQNLELSRGIFDPANKEVMEEARRKGGTNGGRKSGKDNAEKGLGLFNPLYKDQKKEWGRKGGLALSKQVWQSTVDGFISTASGVAVHNKSIGADSSARVRIK
jgi:hypothetical protein